MGGKVISLNTERLEDAHSFIDELIDKGHTTLIVLGIKEKNEAGEECRQYSFASFGYCWFSDRVYAAQRYVRHVMKMQDKMDGDLADG